MKKRSLFTGLLIHLTLFAMAQQPCATPEANAEQRRYLKEQFFQNASEQGFARNAGTTCIPIRLYIFREDDGSGGLSEASMARGLSFLNDVFQIAGIEFYYASRAYFNDSDAYHYNQQMPDNDVENDLTSTAGESSDAINMYVVNEITTASGFQAAGYAYLPYGDFNLYNRIVMTDVFFSLQPHGTLTHELGHYFGLLHTHSNTENGNMDPMAEAVPRTGPNVDCSTDGDMICDTEADPLGNSNNMMGCTYTGDDGMMGVETDEYGNAYTPPQNNIMSYYSSFCQNQIFTAGQYAVMQQGLITRQGFSSNTLDAAPMVVAVPSNVVASLNTQETGIDITWQDNANNEFGYVIERSTTSAAAGFSPITYGSVASDVITYADEDIIANTTYYYRIKPINGDCNTYSAVASYSVGNLYCVPSITICDEYLERVMIGSIDNNSSGAGCTNGEGFTRYFASTNMAQSGTYPLQAIANTSYIGDELGVWVDWNQNGNLEDAGEFYNLGAPDGSDIYSGNIVVPPNALLGNTRMRIRLSYTVQDALDPCNTQLYGEVEDYTLNVLSAPLPVSWLYIRASAQNEGIAVNWATTLERDNDYFAIERLSINDSWQEIGRLSGRNGNGESYRFLDANPLAGINYYRIKQVDYSGAFSYSDVADASWASATSVTVFPNPAKSSLHIYFREAISHRFRLLNTMGQVVLESTASLGDQTTTLDVSILIDGYYFLMIEDENHQVIHREQVVIVK